MINSNILKKTRFVTPIFKNYMFFNVSAVKRVYDIDKEIDYLFIYPYIINKNDKLLIINPPVYFSSTGTIEYTQKIGQNITIEYYD